MNDFMKDKAMGYGKQGFGFAKEAAQSTNEKDKEMWEIIKDFPTLEGIWPFVCLALNFFIPGTGTVLCGCLADPNAWSKMHMGIGVTQMLTSFYIIGWVWSIYWGILIVMKAFAKKGGDAINGLLNKDAPKSDSMVGNNN